MASAASAAPAAPPVLGKGTMLLAALVLALANFMVVLDTTIANVSIAHIAGGLGISASEGTWVITSYAVAEAICVPLTGWLAKRFGTVRVFALGMIGFGLFSFLCGVAWDLTSLVAFRVGQGICGGPLMPISQTLLLQIFPKEKHGQATGIWAMTTIVAPILGPILGGTISDNWSWHWIFFINIPIAALCAFGVVLLMRPIETATEKMPIDTVGMIMLVIWIGSLQLMLDLGREHDWFGSPLIVMLAVVAASVFILFLIWEAFETSPAVNLRVFRHRGFSVSVLALVFAFGTFFASLVVIPLWLQTTMGYTATWAGFAMAWNGVGAIMVAPIVASLSNRVDQRILVSIGISWMGITSLIRVFWWTSGSDFWTLALPQLIQGVGMPFFFIPLTTLALGAVDEDEMASAAGVMNFLRTMAGAIGTALVTTLWYDGAQTKRSELAGILNGGEQTMHALQAQGLSAEQARAMVSNLVDSQATVLSTGAIFVIAAITFLSAAAIVWMAPRPKHAVDAGQAH